MRSSTVVCDYPFIVQKLTIALTKPFCTQNDQNSYGVLAILSAIELNSCNNFYADGRMQRSVNSSFKVLKTVLITD